MRIVNLFAGPSTGKSTTAAALFAELKYRGVNCEYIPEYAKDAAWEGNRGKLFAQQDYLFAKQHWRIAKVIGEVDIIVTDSPLLLGLVYVPTTFAPSLAKLIVETHEQYDNYNVFLRRNAARPYNPKGRLQDEAGARAIDAAILKVVTHLDLVLDFNRETPKLIIDQLIARWGQQVSALLNT